MLLIGDIHITSKYKDSIIQSIRDFVSSFDDKHIVFLWDFVYHFSYDRNLLLELFDLFVEFYKKGKKVYILAGNHDWIKQRFVFDQAKKSFDLFSSLSNSNSGLIKFITDIETINIDDDRFMFVPYNIIDGIFIDTGIKQDKNYKNILKKIYNESIPMLDSLNKKEVFSAKLNLSLINQISQFYTDRSEEENLYLLHHYYIEGKDFPWQYGQFKYKDVALSSLFLELEDVYMISGHLHKAFSYKNYVCVGSSWATNPLERNDFKHFFRLDSSLSTPRLDAYLTDTNYYMYVDDDDLSMLDLDTDLITKDSLSQVFDQVYSEYKSFFDSDSFVFQFDDIDYQDLDLHKLNLILKLDNIDYWKIDEYVDENMVDSLGDIQIQKETMKINKITDLMEKSNRDLQNSIGDWKSLLKDYVQEKYWKDKDKYLDQLDELEIF